MQNFFQYFTSYYGIDIVSAILTILGIYFLGNKNRLGFALSVFASIGGVACSIMMKSISYAIIDAIVVFLNLRGFIKWGKNDSES